MVPPRFSRREFVATAGLGLVGLKLGLGCKPGGPASYGLFLDENVVEVDDHPVAFLSTALPRVELTIRDVVENEDVWVGEVVGSAQPSQNVGYLGATWEREVELPTLPPGCYAVSIPESALPASALIASHDVTQAYLYVRDPDSSNPVLLVTDSPTSDAYNPWGGASFYSDPWTTVVSRRRPGVVSRVLRNTPRVARLLDELDHGWDVVDTETLVDDPEILEDYALVILVGQTEYVSRPFRDALEEYFDDGGRLLVLGNELLLFQTRRLDDLIVCHKFPALRGHDPVGEDEDPEVAATASYEWARSDPETRFLGVSTWLAKKPGTTAPWTVHRADHWLWEDTGLGEGDPFYWVGANQLVDGTLLYIHDGLPYPDQTELTRTPDDFLILGSVPTQDARPFWLWADDLDSGPSAVPAQQGWGTIGLRANEAGGALIVIPDVRLVPASSWNSDPTIQQVVANAIEHLLDDEVDAYAGY